MAWEQVSLLSDAVFMSLKAEISFAIKGWYAPRTILRVFFMENAFFYDTLIRSQSQLLQEFFTRFRHSLLYIVRYSRQVIPRHG